MRANLKLDASCTMVQLAASGVLLKSILVERLTKLEDVLGM